MHPDSQGFIIVVRTVDLSQGLVFGVQRKAYRTPNTGRYLNGLIVRKVMYDRTMAPSPTIAIATGPNCALFDSGT
jgi:hypothetical protein